MPLNCRGGGHFLFIQNLIFFVTIYKYKLLQAFLPKASVENSSAQWAIFIIKHEKAMLVKGQLPFPPSAVNSYCHTVRQQVQLILSFTIACTQLAVNHDQQYMSILHYIFKPQTLLPWLVWDLHISARFCLQSSSPITKLTFCIFIETCTNNRWPSHYNNVWCPARLKISFELNPVTKGKQGTFPFFSLKYLTKKNDLLTCM